MKQQDLKVQFLRSYHMQALLVDLGSIGAGLRVEGSWIASNSNPTWCASMRRAACYLLYVLATKFGSLWEFTHLRPRVDHEAQSN